MIRFDLEMIEVYNFYMVKLKNIYMNINTIAFIEINLKKMIPFSKDDFLRSDMSVGSVKQKMTVDFIAFFQFIS